MCVTVVYEGVDIDTMPQARRVLGDANMVVCEGYSLDAYTGDSCLCPLDIYETAKSLDCVAERSEDDAMRFIFRRGASVLGRPE